MFWSFEFRSFGFVSSFDIRIFEFIRLLPDKTSFLVTILTGKRLIPFRTQKLSPLRPMVVRMGESRSSPGFIKAETEENVSAFSLD
jgi:hypothetical protein